MAKRSAPDEQPYRPLLDQGLMQSAIAHVATPASNPDGPMKAITMRSGICSETP